MALPWHHVSGMITVRPRSESELAWANERYAEIRFVPSSTQDLVAIAEIGGARAALGRLVPVEDSTGELGGIYVLPEFRGRGVAAAIVAWLIGHSPYQQLFCIPFSHLESFYRGFGFEPVPPGAAVPATVAGKVAWCAQHYPDRVSLLVRAAR